MPSFIIDYSEIHNSRKPKIRMLNSCMWWEEGETYVIQYEEECPLSRNLYFNDVCGGITVVNTMDEGKDFVWVKDAKKELRESLKRSIK